MTEPSPLAEIHPFPKQGARAGGEDRLRDPARLSSLDGTGLVDGPPEAAFDRAVRLATRILGTPVGLLSLVDGERQFFKAQTGLPEPTATARETPLTHSFCQHVVANDAPLVVRDARTDPLAQNNLAIRDLGVIAYLGVPVRAPDGHVLGSLCAIQSEPRDWTDADREMLEDVAAGVEAEIGLRAELARSAAAEAQVTAAEERFRLALHAGRIGTYDYDPTTGTAQWDDELLAIWGVAKDEPDVFAAAERSIHPDDLTVWRTDVAASLSPGGTGRHDLEMRIVRPDTGATRWVHAVGEVRFEDGAARRMLGTVRDITDRKEAEARERLLTRELNHRVKNLFAVVSGMIGLVSRVTNSPREMASALRDRIHALASAHALIQPAITGETMLSAKTTLQALLAVVIEPHLQDEERISVSGPVVSLQAEAATSLALVLHELATNAAKHGALSMPEGELAIDWTCEGDGPSRSLRLTWRERGGPPVEGPPRDKGFGSTLIDMTMRGQMAGTLETDWDGAGAVHRLTLPMSRLQ